MQIVCDLVLRCLTVPQLQAYHASRVIRVLAIRTQPRQIEKTGGTTLQEVAGAGGRARRWLDP